MRNEQPGIAFEKAVAAIQAQIDPTSSVTHNETLVDRLGHSRQFDVVIRGNFAGQQMLGVIECKDLKRKVGNPDVDAFITKAQEINANFKILMSKTGFSKPALEKCSHYGIQPLSLLQDDPEKRKFFIGTRWTADLTRWRSITVQLHFAKEPVVPIKFDANALLINGKKVLDWYTNFLLDHEHEFTDFGWIAGIDVMFDEPRYIKTQPDIECLCTGISFCAERVCDQLERLVGINGIGFLNWNSQQITFPPGSTITTEKVPADFSQWAPRSDSNRRPSGFIEMHIEATAMTFERIADTINLASL